MGSFFALDNVTLILIVFAECLTLSGLMVLLRFTIPRFKGFFRWSIGEVLIGTGFLLLGFQLKGNYVLGMVVANTIIIGGICLLSHGLHAFLGPQKGAVTRRDPGIAFYIPVFVVFPLLYWFTLVHSLSNARMLVMSIMLAGQFLVTGCMLFFRSSGSGISRGSALFTAGVFWALGFWFFCRCFFVVHETEIFMKVHTSPQNVTIVLLGIGAIAWTFGLMLMASTRLVGELSRKEGELQKREKDRLVRTIVDNLPQKVILKDLSSRYLICNRAFAESVGIDADTLTGTNDFDHCAPDMAERFQAQDRQVIESGHILEYVDIHNERGRFTWQETVKAPLYGEDGKVQGVLTVFRDITDRIEAEKMLQESEQRYRDLSGKLEQKVEERTLELKRARRDIDLFFEVTLEYLCILDIEGRFMKVSPSWTRELGWREDELIGRNFLELVHPDGQEIARRDIAALGAGRHYSETMTRCARADGSWVWISFSATGLPSRGLIIGAGHDISSRVHMEHQLEAAREEAETTSRSKSQFIATMSHELRTPLNAVLGYSLLLDAFVTEARGRNYLKSITSAGKSLLAIINDLLDLTKMDAGKIELKLVPFNPQRVLREIEDIFRFSAEEKRISLELNATDRLPLSVLLDPDRLRQVLINIVGNAVKFTDRGSVIVTMDALDEGIPAVRNDPRASWKATLVIEVTDTGIGITEDYRKRLFEPFSQQDPEISRRFGGTGLGLAIAKRLLDLMGATISCDAPENGGTRFRIVIPAISAAGVSGEHFISYSGTNNRGGGEAENSDMEQIQTKLSEASREIESLVAHLNRLSTLDEPTGLLNRKSIFARLEDCIENLGHSGGALSLLICDIDQLKRVNDGWGYPVGDGLLAECAQRLAREIGAQEFLGRWVSESYLVILPDVGIEASRQRAERMRHAIDGEAIEVGGERFAVTMSLGVCHVEVDSPTDARELLVALLRSVDDALSRAKAKGRNRYEVAELKFPAVPPVLPND